MGEKDEKIKINIWYIFIFNLSVICAILEGGIGYVKLMVVAYKVPDGRILLGAVPIMSYYEFKHPMND